jgi:RNA polymerase sigma-70 factor (ECF subfamily)
MAQGDQEALAALYDDTSSLLFSLALRILRRREDAEEAVLDAYSRAWRLAARFDPARASVLTWLVMIARSVSIDRLRATAARESRSEPLDGPQDPPDPGEAPEMEAVFSQQRDRVRAALNRLPVEQREAIELAFFEGLSHSELAERTGLPLGTVKTRVRLGLGRLREHLMEWS